MSRRLNRLDQSVCVTAPTRAALPTKGEHLPDRQTPPDRICERFKWMASQAAPEGGRRRMIVMRLLRLGRTFAREGFIALARRKAADAAARSAERSSISRFAHESWQPDGRPVFLLVSHHYGGGIERHVRDLEGLLRSARIRPVLVRPGQGGSLVWEERGPRDEIAWCRASRQDRESIEQLIDLLNPAHAHVHHLAGVPGALVEILAEDGIPFDWTIHDYHAICPRIQLIGAQGVYCGEPSAAVCNACLNSLGDDQGSAVNESITDWRERFRQHLGRARRVFVPGNDVARRIARYMPELRLVIRPHFEHMKTASPLAERLLPGEPVRALVLGTIVRAKGSERLLACARDARCRRLPLEFHIVGSTDRNAQFARLKNVHVGGRYRDSEVFDRLAAVRCHLAFLPTVCPESFMYTLSIVMAAGFYTVCHDLGAQADRVRAWGWGKTLPLDLEVQEVNDTLVETAERLACAPAGPAPPAPAVYPDPLKSYYGFSDLDLEDMRLQPSHRHAGRGATPRCSERKVHAYLH